MKIKEILTDEEFEKAIEKNVTLVDFNAPWCSPCRSQEPILESVSEEMKGKAKVVAVNVDNHREIALKYSIKSIPTLIIFKNGKEVQRFIGMQNEATLIESFRDI